MKRLVLVVITCAAAISATGAQAVPADRTDVCVGANANCFATLQDALAAAHNGDTIHLGPGTYAGAVTIDVSVKLDGAGAGRTVISGGGPVLTIGVQGAASEPTVEIAAVTITGGLNTSNPSPFVARGGGIDVPRAANGAAGATVTINNSVISGNRAAPEAATDSTLPCPPDITITCINGDLPFAAARGAGIATSGSLTLNNTTVSDNTAGSSAASDAEGAAIFSLPGSDLTLDNSTISQNTATAVAPNGRFADSGAIFARGSLIVANSVISSNSATLSASMPTDVVGGTLAIAGGVHVTDTGSASIHNTTISDNSAAATNSVGDAIAFSGGLQTDVNFDLTNDTLSGNSVSSITLPGSTGNAYGDSGAGEMSGSAANTRLTGNTVTVTSSAGDASAAAGAAMFAGSLTNNRISDNHVHASSANGTASVFAGGLMTADTLTLRNTTVSGNEGSADGPNASAQGGGVFDATIPGPWPPGGALTLLNSRITDNTLTGSAASTLQGGGLYIQTWPLTQTNAVITDNAPDQCLGC